MSIITRLNKIERRIVDLYNKLKKAESSSGGGGDFIPLTGTEVGNPVSGNIEFGSEENFLIATDGANASTVKITKYGGVGLESSIGGILSSFNLVDDKAAVYSNNSVLSKGLSGSQDFTPNITDLDYVQKKYVDQKVADSRPYKVYTALLTQLGTDAPVVTVLENTLGDIAFLYTISGQYQIISDNLFTISKTCIFTNSSLNIGEPYSIYTKITDSNNITLQTLKLQERPFGEFGANDILDNSLIEIRVYN